MDPIGGQNMVVIRDGSISTTSVNMNMQDTDLVLVDTCVVTFTGTLRSVQMVPIGGQKMVMIIDGSISTRSVNLDADLVLVNTCVVTLTGTMLVQSCEVYRSACTLPLMGPLKPRGVDMC